MAFLVEGVGGVEGESWDDDAIFLVDCNAVHDVIPWREKVNAYRDTLTSKSCFLIDLAYDELSIHYVASSFKI